jgi:hypothetical protein
MSDGGKGSRPRPYSVTQQEYDTRWDAIFARDLQREQALEKLGVELDQEIFQNSGSSETQNKPML